MTRGFEPVCTNDEARDYFKKCGLTYNDITEGDILLLVLMINRELKKSNKVGETSVNTMSLSKKIDMTKNTNGTIKNCYLYLNSHYFTRREAISFNTDGFVGFAGWADDGNLNPLKRAFLSWCDELKAESSEAYKMAIKALEQQPTDAKTYLKRREENYIEYNVEWFLKNWELELEILSGGKIKPTDADCISREAVKNGMIKYGFHAPDMTVTEFVEDCLPSVTPQTVTEFADKCKECGKIQNEFFNFDASMVKNSEDCISRQAVKEIFMKYEKFYEDRCESYISDVTEVESAIDDLPSVIPRRKKGRWINKFGKEQGYDIAGIKTWYIQIMCDKCGFIKTAIEGHTGQYKYCPNCGAEMGDAE